MYDDKVIALEIALKAVLSAARERGVDVDQLSEAAIDGLLKYNAYRSVHVGNAANEIEHAMDALEYPWPAVG